MRHRRTLLILTALAMLAAVAATAWVLLRQPGVTVTTLARLKPGMSESEVAAILGPPTADVTDDPPSGVPAPVAGGRLLEYAGERATAWVEFDVDGRLVRCRPVIHKVTGVERVRLRMNWW